MFIILALLPCYNLQYCLKYISTFALKWFRHVVIKNYNYSFSGYKEILHNGTI